MRVPLRTLSKKRKIILALVSVVLVPPLLLAAIIFTSIPLARWENPDDLMAVDYDQPIAIDHINLVTMVDGQVLEDRQLLIRDGIIEAINDAGAPVDDEYQRIDAEAGWLVPGLFEMHIHLWDRKDLALSLTYGITSVRNMGGMPMHLRWRNELQKEEWLGSNLYTASPILNGAKYSNILVHKVVEDPQKARELVRLYAERGYDFIKTYETLSLEVFNAIIDESQSLGISVAGHIPDAVAQTDYTLAKPMKTMEHVEEIFHGPLGYEYDYEKLDAAIADLKAMDLPVSTTRTVFEYLTRYSTEKEAFLATQPLESTSPAYRFISENLEIARWLQCGGADQKRNQEQNEFFQEILKRLHEAGVTLVCASDSGSTMTPVGIGFHREMELYAEAGITPHEILHTATINSARVLDVDDQYGSIEVGKVADLVFVKDNPLNDIGVLRSPDAVIKRGQYLDEQPLRELRDSAGNPSSFHLGFGRILEAIMVKQTD